MRQKASGEGASNECKIQPMRADNSQNANVHKYNTLTDGRQCLQQIFHSAL